MKTTVKYLIVKKLFIITIFMSAYFLITTQKTALAFSYQPDMPLKIISEYSLPNNTVQSRIWNIIPEIGSDKTHVLKFYPEIISAPICELKIFSKNDKIQWLDSGRNQEKTSINGLFLMTGFPAPCNILPVGQKLTLKETYENIINTGGRSFIKKYHVFWKKISIAEAIEKRWIKSDIIEPSCLYMITVLDEKNNLTVKQLWHPDGNWWIYEETLFRRSWVYK